MRTRTAGVLAALAAALFLIGNLAGPGEAGGKKGKMLAHMVFFTLKDRSPEAKQKLVDACKKYLDKHPGTVYFSAGVLCEELDRDVNDRDFDVALHLVFDSKAAHDQYQVAPRHNQFIDEQKDNWKQVRVFDSVVE